VQGVTFVGYGLAQKLSLLLFLSQLVLPMKMSEILQLVKPGDNHPCFHDMAEQFDGVFTYCKDYAKWESRMSETYIIKWMCTDTLVGTSVIFMDGKPVAVAKQMARKSDKEFYWISAKTRNKVHMFMLTLVDTPVREFELVDMEEDITISLE